MLEQHRLGRAVGEARFELRAAARVDVPCVVVAGVRVGGEIPGPWRFETFQSGASEARAIALPAIMSEDVPNYFLDVFDRPQRTFDKCERALRPAELAQVLRLMNGQWLHDKVSDPAGRLPALLKADKSDEEIIRVFYRAAFGRQPTADEQQTAAKLILLAPTRKEGLEELLWSLCNSKEFLFNH